LKRRAIDVEGLSLNTQEKEVIGDLINIVRHNPPLLDEMWYLLDYVWKELGCDNRKLKSNKIEAYYKHPVWILNGLFIERHDDSMRHRNELVTWCRNNWNTNVRKILDFGGGYGTVARLFNREYPMAKIEVFEPFPIDLKSKLEPSNISYTAMLGDNYDIVLAIDVLEHLQDPIETLLDLVALCVDKGCLILANCFRPVIQCHLPKNFHLHFSFDLIARLCGLKQIWRFSHSNVRIYQKHGDTKRKLVKLSARFSSILYPFLNFLYKFYRFWKKLIHGSTPAQYV
jgi:hypothetical protein